MTTLASHTLFRLATTLVALLAVVAASAAGAGMAHGQRVDDSLPPLADLTIASEYVDDFELKWAVTVKNDTVGTHPGMHVSLVKVRYTISDPVRGDTTGTWTFRNLGPGSSVTEEAAALFHFPTVTDEPEKVPQRFYAEIIESYPLESPRFRFNNATEHWIIENRHDGFTYVTNGDVGIDVPSISDRLPRPGGATTFTVAAHARRDAISSARYSGSEAGHDHTLFDVQVEISLSPGLSFAANQPEAPSSEWVPDGTTFDATTGIWKMGTLIWRPGGLYPSLQVVVNLTADSLADLPLEERCLTAKVVNVVPWFANDPLKRQNDTATACLGKELLSSGTMDLMDYYPCINDTSTPCTSADTLELVVGNRVEYRQPESFIFHVPDPDGRFSKNGSLVWSTVNLMNLRHTQTKLTDSWSIRDSVKVTAPGGGDAPGRWLLTDTDDSAESIDLLDAMDSSTVTNAFFDLSDIGTDPTQYFLNIKVDFWALGTYEALLGITGRLSGTTYTDSGTYIFHVGPIAELEARDGEVSPDVAAGETAITIVAVNNGPDDPLGAKVEVTLPQGATVARAIHSAGSYNNGVWDIGGELRHKDYYRLSGGRLEGEELTLVLNCPTGGCGEATARIYNDNDSSPYTVCIASDLSDVAAADETACTATTGNSWHEVTVYDHVPENNTTTLRARPGTGGGGPDAPVAGSRSPRSEPSAIILEWGPVVTVNGWEVSHYEVERSSSSWQQLANKVACPADADACQFVDITPQTGQPYRYRVRAVNDQGAPGPWSLPMEIGRSITTGAPEAPELSATAKGRTEIELTWDKPNENGSSIISYTIEVSDRSNGPWAVPDPAPSLGPDATSWSHTGLTGDTRKYYRLLATNSQGDSDWSEVVSATTDEPIKPGAPRNVSAAPDGASAIDVRWEAPVDDGDAPITRYEVQWSADGSTNWQDAGSTADGMTTTFKNTGLTFGTTRYYRVAARNSAGRGEWSTTPAMAKTLAGVPGAPRLSARAVSAKLHRTEMD